MFWAQVHPESHLSKVDQAQPAGLDVHCFAVVAHDHEVVDGNPVAAGVGAEQLDEVLTGEAQLGRHADELHVDLVFGERAVPQNVKTDLRVVERYAVRVARDLVEGIAVDNVLPHVEVREHEVADDAGLQLRFVVAVAPVPLRVGEIAADRVLRFFIVVLRLLEQCFKPTDGRPSAFTKRSCSLLQDRLGRQEGGGKARGGARAEHPGTHGHVPDARDIGVGADTTSIERAK
mmetsp:Transcript_79259/g.224368  ORF Transcript_79259/g.224368 Transcript_79259/m.224368 type:complete len:232 (+) Transcript_79259:280-975(+)